MLKEATDDDLWHISGAIGNTQDSVRVVSLNQGSLLRITTDENIHFLLEVIEPYVCTVYVSIVNSAKSFIRREGLWYIPPCLEVGLSLRRWNGSKSASSLPIISITLFDNLLVASQQGTLPV
jgi:hypothetical protein